MKITIERAENGYILYADDEEQMKTVVYDDDDMEEMKKLLTKVAECFGEVYDKFSKTNLNITFDKEGHKVCDAE